MSPDDRPLRADAERNRRHLLEAAQAAFGERGLDVGVAEIAQRAGVGRATLFRNFPTKEDLIAAIVVERIREGVARGQSLLEAPDAGEALFEFLRDLAGRQQVDRALFDAVADTFLANDAIRAAVAELIATLEALLSRAQQSGAARADIGAVDLMMLIKGICVASSAFAQIDPEITERQLDLMRGALGPHASAQPLHGRAPTMEDMERAFPGRETAAPAAAPTPPAAAEAAQAPAEPTPRART
jgi:AcrR family transcriptional regulator